MPAVVIAFVTQALSLAPLFIQAYNTIEPLVEQVTAALSKAGGPTAADLDALTEFEKQASAELHARALQAADPSAV